MEEKPIVEKSSLAYMKQNLKKWVKLRAGVKFIEEAESEPDSEVVAAARKIFAPPVSLPTGGTTMPLEAK